MTLQRNYFEHAHRALRFGSKIAAISCLDTANFIVLACNIEHGVCTLVVVKKKKLLILKLIELKRKRKKRYWVSKVYRDQQETGDFHMLVRDLRLHDHEYFFASFRLSPSTFEERLSFVASIIREFPKHYAASYYDSVKTRL